MGPSAKESNVARNTSAAFFGSLLLPAIVSFLTGYRTWGVNWWGYLPGYSYIALFLFGVSGYFVVWRTLPGLNHAESTTDSSRQWWLTACFTIVGTTALFVVFRNQTHFLGDGYSLLGLVGGDIPYVKWRNFGEMWLHVGLARLLSASADAALLSYRVVSAVAGAMFLAVTAASASLLFRDFWRRVLFLLGAATGGYTLLFFGYVENYAVFVLSVAVFVLGGLLYLRGILPRWLAVGLVGVPPFLHIFGVVLLAPAAYLLLHDTSLWHRVRKLSTAPKLMVCGGVFLALVALYVWLRSESLILHFSLLGFSQDRFTLGGYTLFSVPHALDYANLLMLLLPGILVLVVSAFHSRVSEKIDASTVFLVVTTVACLLLVFLVDPRLGMSRDWDMLSFAGVPLTSGAYWLVLRSSSRYRLRIAGMMVLLSLLILGPRVYIQAAPEASVAVIEDYLDLDVAKSRTGRYMVAQYHQRRADTTAMVAAFAAMRSHFPDEAMLEDAQSLFDSGRSIEAVSLLYEAIDSNSQNQGTWISLSAVYNELGNYDSAIAACKVAQAISADHPAALSNLGYAYFYSGDLDRAERIWHRALAFDPARLQPLLGLAELLSQTGRIEEYEKVFLQIIDRPDAPVEYLRAGGQYFLIRDDRERAVDLFQRALKKGMDSTVLLDLSATYPYLKQLLELSAP